MNKKSQKKNITSIIALLIVLVSGAFGLNLDKFTGPTATSPSSTVTENKNTALPTEADLQPVGNNPGITENGPANFTAAELKWTDTGWIDYFPLDSQQRPTGAEALLTKEMINTGTSANRDIRPPGFISGPKYDHSRGHLIAKQFGGSGDEPKNLVTLYQYPVNDPYMNFYELKIRHALNEGDTVRYRVTPIYQGKDLLPSAVTLDAKGLTQHSTIDFSVTIPNVK
ncbi:DNA-entry nuclease [Enterococcus sp. JM4C]|uniref:DNA/RNA non-specific endonuclease n=1 Tax=Candidatus Enterococcus huntleyi TaxID=1857217 RepID=UPI0013796B68|nr:DNA/RNA non-specific endonuclease [Enterococcus sp. JM4C]KAF1297709.1 DNA-entry nuclease [Enterococcus sp. JM4C]